MNGVINEKKMSAIKRRLRAGTLAVIMQKNRFVK